MSLDAPNVLDFRCCPPLQPYATLFRMKSWLVRRRGAAAKPGFRTMTPSMGSVGTPGALGVWWREIEEAGVSAVCASGRFAADHGSIEAETLAELQRAYAGRFYGMVWIDLNQDIDDALATADKAIRQLGLRGIYLESDVRAGDGVVKPDSTLLFPIYELMQSLGAAVMWSPRPFSGPDVAFAVGVASIDRVLDTFPRLTIVLGHAGYPYIDVAMQVAARHSNLYLCPDMYVWYARRRWWAKHLTALSDQFVYGSAYPFASIREPLVETLKLPVTDAVMEKYLWTNGAHVLGLTRTDADAASVVLDYLNALSGENVDAIVGHYADDAILFTQEGSFRGGAELHRYFTEHLRTRSRDRVNTFEILQHAIVDNTVYVLWRAEPYVAFASDSYVVRNGRIVLQTWASRGVVG